MSFIVRVEKGGEMNMNKKLLAQAMAAVFILVGLLGFVNDPVLGLFEVDTIHNLIHLGSGILGFALLSRGTDGAVNYGRIMTVVYGLVTVLNFLTPAGFIEPEGKMLGFITTNMADAYLHLFFTAVFAYLGFFGTERRADA